jgi:hypothetical protein
MKSMHNRVNADPTQVRLVNSTLAACVKYLLLILTLTIATGCSSPTTTVEPSSVPNVVVIEDVVTHPAFSEQVAVSPEWGTPRGLGIGYVFPNERNLPPDQRTQSEEIQLQEGEPFAPYLFLHTPESTTVLVSMLLDYQQIEFELDGKIGLLHEIKVKPNGDLELPINVDIKEKGTHDLVVVAFGDPYNNSLDPFYWSSGVSVQTIARRAVVIVGDDASAARELPQPLTGQSVPDEVELGLEVAFATDPVDSGSHPAERQLYVATGASGEAFSYQLWVSNLDGQSALNYAIVTFNNFHQVPVNGNDVTTVLLQPDEELIVDTSVLLPAEPGINKMQMIYLLDPYKSVLHEEVKAAFVFSSFRVAIEAK